MIVCCVQLFWLFGFDGWVLIMLFTDCVGLLLVVCCVVVDWFCGFDLICDFVVLFDVFACCFGCLQVDLWV